MSHVPQLLKDALLSHLQGYVANAEPGHCVRIDDIDHDLALDLGSTLAADLPHVAVNVLRSEPRHGLEIRPERAIELRNRKAAPCLLLVPVGEGHAASSLDNSFQRVPVLAAYQSVEGRLLEAIEEPRLRDVVRRNKRWLRSHHAESWAEFLAELCENPHMVTFGRNLWRVGLIPDLGDEPELRLERNRLAVRTLSRPSRPAASIDERLTAGGMQEGAWRVPIRRFCEQRGAHLANPRIWGQEIAEHHPELSFDKWRLAESVHEDLEALEVEPFRRPDGSLDKSSKLDVGADGQLLLRIPENGTAPLVVKWRTDPPKVAAVTKWLLEVVLPEDMRTDEAEPLATTTVKGELRRGTIKVSVDEDSLQHGSRYVVSVTALGEHGDTVALTSGEPAVVDSQEFQVLAGEDVQARTRRSAAVSVPEAVVRAALDGVDDLTEDLVSWDLEGQVFGLRLGNRRGIQVRVCESIVRLQRLAASAPNEPMHFVASASYGAPLEGELVESRSLTLPVTVRRARADFLSALAARGPRDTAESLEWDDELRDAARAYLATYKRALDASDPSSVRNLLLLDTFSLAVRRSNEMVYAVVVLPIHPLRLAWIAEHDCVLREWADRLTQVTPRGARPAMVDAHLAAQVMPANLPFSVLDHEGHVAIYAEELTFGAGLYLMPGSVDSEAAAEAVCSVLGLERVGSTMRASSRMVAERINAYEAAHDPGGTLRVLAVNPGSGELVAGALSELSPAPVAEADDQFLEDPRRLEVLCYSDSADYISPVPALKDLQRSFRTREFRRRSNHLFPPLSLTVRSVDRLLEDDLPAHLTVIQDVGGPVTTLGPPTERDAAFRDLLVPLVTRSYSDKGDLVWESVPSTGHASGGREQDLFVAHRSHQRAMGRALGSVDGAVPCVQVVLDGEHQARINVAHERTDWVIGVDRFVGVDLYEGGPNGGLNQSYILDYAPDFVEGIGDRLTVTTSHRTEVERLLEGAMRELGLGDVEESVRDVLSTLAVVSGRLALRLLEDSSLAREAVSLAAVVTHLRERGELDGLVVVPVDAHPEIFGASARGEGTARRCDLLLVRLGQRSFKIECVEVKSRKEARLPQALADRIVDQVQDTRRLLEARFFAADPPRIDLELQRARLVSLLHYYADRSANHGLIEPERIQEVHRYIDRVGDTGEAAEITMRGYVVSLEGAQGFNKRYGEVPLTVLTAEDLGRLGFTTEAAASGRGPAEERSADELSRLGQREALGPPQPRVGETRQALPAADRKATSAGAAALATTAPEGERIGGSTEDAAPLPTEPLLAEATVRGEAQSTDQGHASEQAVVPSESGSQGEGSSDSGTPLAPRELEVVLGKDAGGADVVWRVSTKGSPHAFVIGIPGQGKSVSTRKIIRDFSMQGLPSLVFDFHGDMAADPPPGYLVLDAAEGLPFSPFEPDVRKGRPINTTAWEIAEVIGYVAKLGEIQRNHVYKALQRAYAEHGWVGTGLGEAVPTMDDFAVALEAVETGAQGKNARARLQPFTDFGLFADDAEGGFSILDGERNGLVLDVSRIGLEEVQRFAASFMLRRIYREMFTWAQDGTMKLVVVLDEAHRMAKDVTLPKIMKEGRKYGVGVVVASQSAHDFHTDVLGNAGTKVVFRTNYPASKSVGGFLRGRSGIDLTQEIERLAVGVAYVSTPDVAQARKVYMAM